MSDEREECVRIRLSKKDDFIAVEAAEKTKVEAEHLEADRLRQDAVRKNAPGYESADSSNKGSQGDVVGTEIGENGPAIHNKSAKIMSVQLKSGTSGKPPSSNTSKPIPTPPRRSSR